MPNEVIAPTGPPALVSSSPRVFRPSGPRLPPNLLTIQDLEGILGGAGDVLVDHERAAFLPPGIVLGDQVGDHLGMLGGDVGGLTIVHGEIEELPVGQGRLDVGR